MLFGSALAVARQFGVSPLLVRLLWLAAVIAGGFGVLAYVLIAVFTPAVTPDGIVQRSSRLRTTVILVGLLFGVLLFLVLSGVIGGSVGG